MPSTKARSQQPEIMDNFDLQGKELEKTLKDLDKVNSLLGGNEITVEGVEKVLGSSCFLPPLRIVDVGCGNGSILKEVAQMGRQKGVKMQLVGIDANENAIPIAQENTKDYPEISFRALDVFSEEFKSMDVDIIMCTLTLHHFSDEEIKKLLKLFSMQAKMGVVINDLQRSKWAYYLFKLFCFFFIRNEINRKDGLTSILRSFKKRDLENYGKNLEVRKQIIKKKWAFRFQWVLLK